jgi:ribose-phosphate pyrophosphokinase
MATEYSERLHKPLVLLHKRREHERETTVTHIVGDVRGQTCLIIDDMISTGGTIVESALSLREAGASSEVFVSATHAVLLEDACDRMASSGVTYLFVTDTLPSPSTRCAMPGMQVHVVSVATSIAAAIRLQLVDRPTSPRRSAKSAPARAQLRRLGGGAR